MLLLIIRITYLIIAAGAVATYTLNVGPGTPEVVSEHPVWSFSLLLLLASSVILVDMLIPKKRIEIMSAIYFGLLIGVLLSFMMTQALGPLFAMRDLWGNDGAAFQAGVIMLSLLVLPYLCISLLLQTKDDFRFVIPYVEFSRDLKGGRPLIIDSSALIDGRVADVVDTRILDVELVVPKFIIQEVQDIADSHDKLRRSRGRRGLDVLRTLQQDPKVDIHVHESDTTQSKGRSVDQRLVELAKSLNGRVLTNDFNLNKVAGVQGVEVVNLNDVANALKPRFIPGEHIEIKLIKEGESAGQGVGYLDDGTMVVCENGGHDIGKQVSLVVTSVLQNSAGRMIFGRIEPQATGDKRQPQHS
ncbi:MAG: PIN/TRAM domain-containing protein [Planctomycetaceae bacterium]|nr:PIN/TRAM domain-containing protein [Planctomycetaceae bacterium]